MYIDPDNLAFLEMMRDDVGMDMEMLLTTAVEIGCGIMREEIAAITAREIARYKANYRGVGAEPLR